MAVLERPSVRRVREARWVVMWGAVWVPAVGSSCTAGSAPSGSRFHCPLVVLLQVLAPQWLRLLEINLELTLVLPIINDEATGCSYVPQLQYRVYKSMITFSVLCNRVHLFQIPIQWL